MAKREQPTAVDLRIYGIIYRFMQALGHLPQPVSRNVGNLLGDLFFWVDRRHRKITLDNLSLAMGGELSSERKWRTARAIYRNLGQVLFEAGWYLCATPEQMAGRIRIEGTEHLQKAYAKGKGVLAVTAHIGNWELLPFAAYRDDLPLNVVYRPLDFEPLNLFFEMLRTRLGAKLIPASHAMIRIARALKRKEGVAILMDQSVDWYDGVWVDFFGQPTCTSKGMALIALKSQAPVLPVFLYRETDGFKIVVGEEIPLVQTGDKTTDIEKNTLNYSKAIEAGVRRHPEQWFWVHRRWKNRPYCPWPPKTT